MTLPFIIGTAQFGQEYGVTNSNAPVDEIIGASIINDARTSNVHYYDTANEYGRSEVVLGKILTPEDQVITKIKPLTSGDVRKKFLSSLKCLQKDQIYGLMIHNPDILLSNDYGNKIWEEMETLKYEGLINKMGISVYDTYTALKIKDKYPVELLQHPLNIFDQSIVSAVNKGEFENVEIHARSLFLQGLFLHDGYLPAYLAEFQKDFDTYNQWRTLEHISPLESCLIFARNMIDQKIISKIVFGISQLSDLSSIIESWHSIENHQKYASSYLKFSNSNIKLINPSLWHH